MHRGELFIVKSEKLTNYKLFFHHRGTEDTEKNFFCLKKY